MGAHDSCLCLALCICYEYCSVQKWGFLTTNWWDRSPVVPPEEGPTADLPEAVIIQLLEREVLLTRAKLHALCYEHIVAEKKLRNLKTQLRQVVPLG